MEPKRLTTRAMLQRVVNLTKHVSELQPTTNLTVPSRNNGWHQQGSIIADISQGLGVNGNSQSPRAVSTSALGPLRKFDFSRAQKALQLELNRRCSRIEKTLRYDPKQCLDLVRDLSQQLRRTVKPDILNNIRYKIVVIVTIVQTTPNRKIHQSMSVVSRCLWNCETDGSITAQAKLGHDMLAIATAFAVYTD
jgi:hypothetical protein